MARLTTEAWWAARYASEQAVSMASRRRFGKGRRPAVTAVDRQQKRASLNVGTFDQLLRRLEEMTGRRGRDAATVLREGLK
jgi:hypothetical protein